MGHKNIKNSCVYNFKGICELNTCMFYHKRCNNICLNFIDRKNHIKKKKEKGNPDFLIGFLKEDDCLILKITAPINYTEFHRSNDGKYNYFFTSYQKEKNIEIKISLVNTESMVLFLFSDFHERVKVKSSILYITLDEISEITSNSTPFKKLPNMFALTKELKNKNGYIDVRLKLNKRLVFSLIDELVHKDVVKRIKTKTAIKPKEQKNSPNINTHQSKEVSSISNLKNIYTQSDKNIIITAIIISDNRKCALNNHAIFDVLAKVNAVTPNGKIMFVTLPAAYCDVCDEYIVLKHDFQKAKEKGVLLCSVENKTSKYIQKHANQKYKTIGESRIHKMGYNVRKDVGYTDMQRRVILANILENTNIARHEILSVIDAGIARHQSKTTHQHAVQCWLSDREFVANYKAGDMPEVLIERMVLKYHLEQ